MKKTSILWLWTTFLFSPVVANALAVLFLSFLIAPLAFTIDVVPTVRRDHPLLGLLIDLAPFVFAVSLVLTYARPVFREWSRKETKSEISDLAKRRLMNAPVYVSFFGFLGWLVASLVANLVLLGLGRQADLWWYVFGVMTNVFTGTMSFLANYYILEAINRKVYTGLLFPRRDLYDLPGLVHISIRSRFLIYFLSAGLLPSLILTASLYIALDRAGGPTGLALALFIIFAVVSLFLTLMISGNFHEPLREIRSAARKIQEGELDAEVNVTSSDEIGELGVGFNRMVAGLREKEKIKQDFGRAVDPRVRDYLLEHEGQLGGEQRQASVLFCDIRGFTAFSEGREPRQVVEILNRYFEQMNLAVEEHQGVVNKFIGDAVMAIFGVPAPDENHAEKAVRAGLEMIYRRDELNLKLAKEGLPKIGTGLGIHSGLLLAGNLGSAERLEYTVIGDSVNLASRLESLSKKLNHEFIISEATHSALPEILARHFTYLARVKVKGKQEAVAVYGYHPAA